MHTLLKQVVSLAHRLGIEMRLFWRSRQSVYLAFLVPMMGMALFVYLGKEGTLEAFFSLIGRALGQGQVAIGSSPMEFLTVGLIAYTLVDVAFESLVPRLVRLRTSGLLKRLGGTPLRGWIFLAAQSSHACLLALAEVLVILAMGLLSGEIAVGGNWWLLAAILLMATLTLAALGFALTCLISTANAAVAAVHAIYIPMILLCGAFVPVHSLPRALRIAAKALPLTYFVQPFRSVMTQGTGLGENINDLIILLAWMLASWILAIKVYRWE